MTRTLTREATLNLDPAARRPGVARIGAGVAAAVGMLAVLVGVPVALVLLAGNPLPTPGEWQSILSLQPDWGYHLFLTRALPCAGWIGWLAAAIPTLIEIAEEVSGIPLPRLGVFVLQQQIAAVLIGVIAAAFSSANAAGSPAALVAASRSAVQPVAFESDHAAPHPSAAGNGVDDRRYRVRRGDTLWGIAAATLGSGARYPRIFDASEHTQQPDGRELTEPDLILPGWNLTIPAPTTGTPTAAPTRAAQPTAVSTHTPGSTTSPTAPAPRATAGPAVAGDGAADRDEIDEPVRISTMDGIGFLAATGLTALVIALRAQRRRRRRVGEPLVAPPEDAAQLERVLGVVANPVLMDRLDTVLRHLQRWADDTRAALPDVIAVRLLDDTATVFLAGLAVLPDPWVAVHADQTAWTVHLDTIAALTGPVRAPFPALVTIGTDTRGGTLLLNLGRSSHLHIAGPAPVTDDVARAIAVELAVMPWAADAHLIVDLRDERLAELASDHVTITTDPHQIAAALNRPMRPADESGGRASEVGTVIVIHQHDAAALPAAPTGQSAVRIATPRLVQVTSGPSVPSSVDLVLEIQRADVAALHTRITAVPPLRYRPQRLTAQSAEALSTLLATLTPPHPPKAPQPSEPTTSPDTEPGPGETDGLPAVEPAASTSPGPDPALQVALGQPVAVEVPAWVPPYLRLLGPVRVDSLAAPGELPGRGAELLAFLLESRETRSGAAIQSQLWPEAQDVDTNNVRVLARRLRAALGTDPDGRQLLPEGRAAGFSIDSRIRSDWDDFRALVGANPAGASDADLDQALALVSGAPLAGVARHRGWWLWAAALEEAMITAVVDAADVRARRALAASDYSTARRAAAIAKAVDSLNEAGWRIELRLAVETDDRRGFDATLDALYRHVGAGHRTYQLDDETQHVVDTARHHWRTR